MRILEEIKKKNRTIVEMYLGIFAIGVLCQGVSLFFPGDRLARAASLLIGSAAACLAVIHMYHTLDAALNLDGKTAQKLIYRGYLIRYVSFAALLVLGALTGYLNPLLIFLAYMSLKGTVYLQPFTHKLCNKVFHETDPEPQPVPDEPEEKHETAETLETK